MKNLLILFIVVFVQASCGQSTETTRSTEKFKEEIAKQDVILLDVRTPEEYAEGHLENSINLNYNDENFASKVDSLDKSKQYEIYCRSGKRSGASVKLMQEKGIKIKSESLCPFKKRFPGIFITQQTILKQIPVFITVSQQHPLRTTPVTTSFFNRIIPF